MGVSNAVDSLAPFIDERATRRLRLPSVLRDAGPALTRRISLDTVRERARRGLSRRHPHAARAARCAGQRHEAPEIFLKLETLQPIGSFKIRGAQNAVARLSRRSCADGVWTVSAGNAAQGVALAARLAGAPCSVMVMDTAPETKLRAIERLGAAIVKATYESAGEQWKQHGSTAMRGRFVHPFDDDDFISGNGRSVSRSSRICRTWMQSSRRSAAADCWLASRSPSKAIRPSARIYAAEPETAAPLSVSLRAGKASRFDAWQRVLRRWRRRQIGSRRHVAVAADMGRRVNRRLAGRRGRGDASGRRSRACDRGGGSGMRGGRGVVPTMAARGIARSSPLSRAATSISRASPS